MTPKNISNRQLILEAYLNGSYFSLFADNLLEAGATATFNMTVWPYPSPAPGQRLQVGIYAVATDETNSLTDYWALCILEG